MGLKRVCAVRLWAEVLRGGLIAAICMGSGVGAFAQSAKDRRFVETSIIEASFDATVMAFSSDETGLYVAGNTDQAQIIRLDLNGVEQRSQSIEGRVSDLIIGPNSVFVIGVSEEETWVESRDLETLDLIGRQTLDFIEAPKGHLGNSGRLYIAGFTPNARNNATLYAVDGTRPDIPVLQDLERRLYLNGAIGNFWVSEEEERIFVNDAEAARMWSVTAEGDVETSIGHDTKIRDDMVPFSVGATVKNDPRCTEVLKHLPNQPTRFVIADYLLGSTNSAVYSRSFGVLDIVSETVSNLKNLDGTELETYKGSSSVRPPLLISASCDQSTILVASRYSDQVVQYTHRVGSNAFELVTKEAFRAGRAVSAVATSDQGNWGAIASQGDGAIVLLNRGLSEEKAETPEVERINRSIQRHLLLVGYRIGAIDGILGGKTTAAIEAFSKKHDLKVDLSDPQAFLDQMIITIDEKGL